jgi:hypothetical protein
MFSVAVSVISNDLRSIFVVFVGNKIEDSPGSIFRRHTGKEKLE